MSLRITLPSLDLSDKATWHSFRTCLRHGSHTGRQLVKSFYVLGTAGSPARDGLGRVGSVLDHAGTDILA